ncbi:unnamed protein product [Closterium sp. NIES-65]|nr:unnamed protein product [Closterium sp. NIES-65]
MPIHSRRSAFSRHVLLPLLLLVLPFISHVTAQTSAKTYPLCPFTQQPPAKPNVTMARCVDASERACCADCSDASNALHGLTANQTVVLEMLKPEIVAIIGNKDVQFWVASPQSLRHPTVPAVLPISARVHVRVRALRGRAVGSNARYGGTYVKASTATTGALTVCDAFATQVYADCKNGLMRLCVHGCMVSMISITLLCPQRLS